jgi:tetratricopeptide (TPR) repeat protein
VNEGLGDVLMLRGAYDEAQNYLDAAVEMAEHSHERARLQGKLGELSFKRGDNTATERAIEAALSALGRRVPRSSWSFILMALWEVLVQVVHSLVPRLSVGRRSLDVAETDLLAARLYSRMAHAYWFGKGTIPTAWAHFKEMNIAERYPPTPELAQAYSEHAPVMTLVTYYKRGIKYALRSLAIRKSLGDVWGQGQSLHFYGVVLYGASRYRECIEKCREALRLLERTGDRWEMNTAGWHIALSH